MRRSARGVVPGAAHHVTQRGTNRQIIFYRCRDRRVYNPSPRSTSAMTATHLEAAV